MSNLYDQLEIDIVKKHDELNADSMSRSSVAFRHNWLRSYFDKFLFVTGIYKRLIDSGFYRAWFLEFYDYWVRCLGGRPLYFHDFFFLYSSYRTRFSDVEIKDQNSLDSFEEAWRDPRGIYSTFGSVYKYTLSPFQYLHFKKYLKSGMKILEYGCGIAPIVAGLINYKEGNFDYTIADIKQFTFHYAKWRLKQFGVKCIDIDSRILPTLPESYDAIFVMQTFEHLPKPFEVIQLLTDHITKGGYLIFDFMISHGHGLDSKQALTDREKVLRYIEEHYEVVAGRIKYDADMGNTVVRKKS